jgi:hypothetical protein
MRGDETKLGICIEVVKSIVRGEEVRDWIIAGIVLGLMNVDEIGSTCPLCKKSFRSRQGLLNHLITGNCYDELKKLCLKASEIDRMIVGRYSWKTEKKVKLYLRNGESILCNYGDYRCVANAVRKLVLA